MDPDFWTIQIQKKTLIQIQEKKGSETLDITALLCLWAALRRQLARYYSVTLLTGRSSPSAASSSSSANTSSGLPESVSSRDIMHNESFNKLWLQCVTIYRQFRNNR